MSDFMKVAVITGASAGIGAAIAVGLAESKTGLCLIGRNSERLEAVAEICRKYSPDVYTFCADLTNDEIPAQLKLFIKGKFGRADILVHSAGLFFKGTFQSAAVDKLDELYRANVRAPYILTQELLPMIKDSRGQIVFINSSQGLRTGPGCGHYSATKHALKAIADALRDEVNPDGVRVLSVYPGRTATKRMARLYELEGWSYKPELLLQPKDVAGAVIHALEMPLTAEITDISIRPLRKSY
jgi:NADP-dependent 3-hydroxy acid dehydrogenase YdfG